ncbi:hypothetical protein SAMN05428977_104520 [Nitrosomonas sp. Nm166]|nr:hypothetical protein SAMN05428977_104520 [Nitrosomonas sp. Nm166]
MAFKSIAINAELQTLSLTHPLRLIFNKACVHKSRDPIIWKLGGAYPLPPVVVVPTYVRNCY